jgi:hypothetical protein
MEYFAKITEPKKLRINFMLAAKGSIICLSIMKNIEEIRRKKLDMIAELKEDFKDTSVYCKALSDLISDEKTRNAILESFNEFRKKELAKQDAPPAFPKAKPLIPVKPQPVKAIPAKAQPVKSKPVEILEVPAEEPLISPVKKQTDVDRLEYTLSQIEQKLADLSK